MEAALIVVSSALMFVVAIVGAMAYLLSKASAAHLEFGRDAISMAKWSSTQALIRSGHADAALKQGVVDRGHELPLDDDVMPANVPLDPPVAYESDPITGGFEGPN